MRSVPRLHGYYGALRPQRTQLKPGWNMFRRGQQEHLCWETKMTVQAQSNCTSLHAPEVWYAYTDLS